MAKAKKSEGAAPKKTASKSKKAPAKPSAPPAQPLVDTNLAAMNAARMLASRAKLGDAAQPETADASHESGNFKQLKQSLNKPAGQAVTSALGNAFGPSKSNLPLHGFTKQTAHNQTQGGFNRINVPRRTGG